MLSVPNSRCKQDKSSKRSKNSRKMCSRLPRGIPHKDNHLGRFKDKPIDLIWATKQVHSCELHVPDRFGWGIFQDNRYVSVNRKDTCYAFRVFREQIFPAFVADARRYSEVAHYDNDARFSWQPAKPESRFIHGERARMFFKPKSEALSIQWSVLYQPM